MFHFIPSSFIYFISGIFVAVGVNLITSNPANFMNDPSDNALIICSIPWLACAAFLTILAIYLESAENDYTSSALKSLSSKEREELKQSIYTKYSSKLRVLALLVLVSFGVGIYVSINNPRISQTSQTKEKISGNGSSSPIE